MKEILAALNEITVASGCSVYIVGGYLRDLLLGRQAGDVDLLVEGPVQPLAREAAHRLSGTLVNLDEGRGLYRLVVPEGDGRVQVDLDEVPRGGLAADLKKRDFTIDALAMPLQGYLSGDSPAEHVIDVLGGLVDLRGGVIRACSPSSIEDDPLRALRAFRMASRLGFVIDPKTLGYIRNMQRSVAACAGERIWEELTAIFSAASAQVIRLMDRETALLGQLFPELSPLKGLEQGGHHVVDAWEHSLKTLQQFESILTSADLPAKGISPGAKVAWARLPVGLAGKIEAYLEGNITRARSRLPLLKLACLLHDVGKPACRAWAGNGKYTFYDHHSAGVPAARLVAQRLKMSARERDMLALLVGLHMNPLLLYKVNPLTPRALRRFFQKAGPETPGLLLLSLADIASTRLAAGLPEEARAYGDFITELLQKYFNEGDAYINPPGFLSGHEVCALLGIKPSPRVRRVLDALADARLEGMVKTKGDAEEFVKRWRDWD